jgi:hypothetical protein
MARSARARSLAARKGWITRRARAEQSQRIHGQIAREKSEARLTPAQKAARTRHANQLERELRAARRSAAAKRGWQTRREAQRSPAKSDRGRSRGRGPTGGDDGGMGGSDSGQGAGLGPIYALDQLDAYDYDPDDPRDFDDFDVETSPDYGED